MGDGDGTLVERLRTGDDLSSRMEAAAEIERLRAVLAEMAGYKCTCHEAFIGRGKVDPDCMAGEVGDDARMALGLDPVCRGRKQKEKGA